ncbi:hypothetical protein GCM10022235_83550 [Kribbella ginsengisoli]|uniref:Secreted protein n=1 Tax=Kribbella ginsengisoli TaxID=363865 RepID=A0ABP6Z9K4_9ACTN
MRRPLTLLSLPALVLATMVVPTSQASATTSGWPENCSYSRTGATTASASCWAGSGFYRVVLICRSIGQPPKWFYGNWQTPSPLHNSKGSCQGGRTVSPDDVGIEEKAD